MQDDYNPWENYFSSAQIEQPATMVHMKIVNSYKHCYMDMLLMDLNTGDE
jgi:hypothetical protein